jgi:hypothetical protein
VSVTEEEEQEEEVRRRRQHAAVVAMAGLSFMVGACELMWVFFVIASFLFSSHECAVG